MSKGEKDTENKEQQEKKILLTVPVSTALTAIPVKKGSYEKPERKNPYIPAEKYDAVDSGVEASVIANDGNIYVPQTSMPQILNKTKPKTGYILDNLIPDEGKKSVNNVAMVNSSDVVRWLDKNSHQTRDSQEADLNRYARDSLTRVGDSDQAEAERRKIDAYVNRELRKLKDKRGSDTDEITGEPLETGAAFHHSNEKDLFNNPLEVIDPSRGINVNPDTHREIHSMNLRDEKALNENKEELLRRIREKRQKRGK